MLITSRNANIDCLMKLKTSFLIIIRGNESPCFGNSISPCELCLYFKKLKANLLTFQRQQHTSLIAKHLLILLYIHCTSLGLSQVIVIECLHVTSCFFFPIV